MANTVVIGRVAVRVYPDTSEFKKDLKRKLDGIEASTDPIGVDAELDAKGLRAEMRKLIQDLKRQARDTLEVKVELDTDDAIKSVDSLMTELEHLTKIQLDEDVNRSLAETSRLLKEVGKQETIDLQVEISGMSKAERQVDQLKARIKDLEAKIVPEMSEEAKRKLIHEIANLKDKMENELDSIDAEVQPAISEGFYRRVQQRLAFLARTRIVTFVPKVSAAGAAKVGTTLAALSGARLSGKIGEDLFDLFKNVDKNLPKIFLLAEGFAGLAGSILSSSANLFALAANLARIGPAALALPGIFGGVAIGVAASLIAFKDFNKRIPEAKKGWESLKKTIQDNFWAQALKPIKELGQKIFPELQRHLAVTSSALGKFFGTFATEIGKRLGGNPLKNMFDDLTKSIHIARDGLGPLVESIRILGEAGAGRLPQLARFFVKLNEQFAAFLLKAEKNGSLQRWIDEGILALRELGTVIKQIARIFDGLATAALAAGGTTLKSLGETLKSIADAIKTPAFQKDLVGVLIAAEQAMTNISKTAGPALRKFFDSFAKTLTVILPMAGQAIGTLFDGIFTALSKPALQQGLVDFFSGLLKGVEALTPAFGPLGNALGAVLTLMGTMATAFGPVLAEVLKTIANTFILLAPSIGKVITALGAGFLTVLQALAPVLADLAVKMAPVIEQLGTAFAQVLVEIAPYLAQFVELLGGGLVDALKILGPQLPEIFGKLFPQLLEVVKQIVPQMPALVDGFLGLVDAIVNTSLVADLGTLAAALLEMINSGAIEALVTNMPILAKATADLALAVADLVVMLGPGLGEIVGFLVGVAAAIIAIFAASIQAFKDYNYNLGLLAGELVRGIALGIVDGVTWVVDAITKISNAIVNAFKNVMEIHSPSGVFKALGGQIIAGLVAGLGLGKSPVVGKAKEMGTWIKDQFKNATTMLSSAGKDIAHGLADGIKAGIDWVTSAARSIAEAAVSAAKSILDINSPSRVFAGIGGYIGDGLVNGILASVHPVEKAMDKLAGVVAGTEMKAPDVQIGVSAAALKKADVSLTGTDDPTGPPDNGAAGNVTFNITNNHPTDEPASVTTVQTLRELQSMGALRP